MPYKDVEKQREFQRKWIASKRAKWISLMGGKCTNCSSEESLEVDHIDRHSKVDHRIWSWKEERIVEELKKCQLLCGKCHRDKTCMESYGHVTGVQHGRLHSYKMFGCRCDRCRKANSQARARQRLKKRGLL